MLSALANVAAASVTVAAPFVDTGTEIAASNNDTSSLSDISFINSYPPTPPVTVPAVVGGVGNLDSIKLPSAFDPPWPLDKSLPDWVKVCDAFQFYEEKNNCKKVLLAMSYGIVSKSGHVIVRDFEDNAFRICKERKKVIPGNSEFRAEVMRRVCCMNLKKPRCNNWTQDKMLEWLFQNPISSHADVFFIQREVEGFINLIYESQNENEAISRRLWTTNMPYLRLYHTLLDDKVYEAFCNKDNKMTREELDARNSDAKPPSFEKLASDLFNDRSFKPTTYPLPELHSDFADAIELSFEDMPGAMTEDDVKNRLGECRTKLILVR
jgi:hypothetical protein